MRIRKKIQAYSTMWARARVVQQTITQWSCQRRKGIIFFRLCKIIIVLLLQDTCFCHCQAVFFIIFSLTTFRIEISKCSFNSESKTDLLTLPVRRDDLPFHFSQSPRKSIKSSHFWQVFPVKAPDSNLHLKHKLSE